MQAVQREASTHTDFAGGFDTVYIGGGTPSLLSPGQVEDLLAGLRKHLSVAPDALVTIEANPGTLSPEKLAGYRRVGVDGVNIGVQSLADADLVFLGRLHDSRKARESIRWARGAGFSRIGVDLICGIPGQEQQAWARQLEEVAAWELEHLSCYMLSYEPGTPLAEALAAGGFLPMPDDAAAALFLQTSLAFREAGYIHYEVSNFARGSQNVSRHNTKYWDGTPYLGLGPAAHSFDRHRRWWNPRDVQAWLDKVGRGERPGAATEILSAEDRCLEDLYLGLRQARGIDAAVFEDRHGLDFDRVFGGVIRDFDAAGLLVPDTGRVRLTVAGWLYLDEIAARLAACL